MKNFLRYPMFLLCIFIQTVYSHPPVGSESEFFSYIKNLVESGGDVNHQFDFSDDEPRVTLLHLAAKNNFVESARYLLEHNAQIKIDGSGATPLHDAAEFHSEAIVDLLLERGANVNLQDVDGNTPLHKLLLLRVGEKTFAIAKKLLNAGTFVNVKNNNEDSPLILLCAETFDSVFLRKTLKLFLDADANCNQTEDYKNTALHVAVSNGTSSVVYKLLTGTKRRNIVNADPNIRNENGETPLHHACLEGKLQEVLMLLTHGADVTIKNSIQQVPLMLAIKSMRIIHSPQKKGEVFKVLQTLIHDPRQDFTVCDEGNRSLLHYAAHYDYTTKLLSFLLSVCPGYVNLCDINGVTPLYYALGHNNFAGVVELLLWGAQTTMYNKNGLTPLGVLLNLKINNVLKIKYGRILISRSGLIHPYLLCKKESAGDIFITNLSQEDKHRLGINDQFISELLCKEGPNENSTPFLNSFMCNDCGSNIHSLRNSSIVARLRNREIEPKIRQRFSKDWLYVLNEDDA